MLFPSSKWHVLSAEFEFNLLFKWRVCALIWNVLGVQDSRSGHHVEYLFPSGSSLQVDLLTVIQALRGWVAD